MGGLCDRCEKGEEQEQMGLMEKQVYPPFSRQYPSSSSCRPKKILLKIVMIGEQEVGKTNILTRYVNSQFTHSYVPTIGADFMCKEIQLDDQSFTLQIWDTAGKEKYQSLGGSFYRGADVALFVYDLTNLQSFYTLKNLHETFIDLIGGQPCDCFVVGNKLDQILSGKVPRVIDYDKVLWYCSTIEARYFEVSALDNIDIDYLFECTTIWEEKRPCPQNIKPAQKK